MDRITKDAAPFTRPDQPEGNSASSSSTNPPALSGHQTTESMTRVDDDDETSRLKMEKAKNSSLEASHQIEDDISNLKLENSQTEKEHSASASGEGRSRPSKTGNEGGGANAIVVEPDDEVHSAAGPLVESRPQTFRGRRSSEEQQQNFSSRHQTRPQVNQTNINIENLNTLVLGNMNQMIAQNGGGGGDQNREEDADEDRRRRLLNKYSDAQLKTLKKRSRCKKLVTDSNVRIVASKLGNEWRSVGNQLHFNHTQLDDIVSAVGGQSSSNYDRAELLLLRWLEWSDHRATVARLVKALHLNDRHDIILALEIDDQEEESGQSSSS